MLEFQWYWVFSLLPLPWLLRVLLPPSKRNQQAALMVPFLEDFKIKQQKRRVIFSRRLLLWLAMVGWILLIIAAARPQWIGEIVQIPTSGRDLMLALDLSGSMKEQDFVLNGRRVNRLAAAKAVAKDFIAQRQGDRIGLIVFGEQPYPMMPLSFDLQAVQEMLNSTFIGLAGENKTAIGDAIVLGMKRLLQYEESNRVLILLTDGTNNSGAVLPEKAADFAARENVKIYTIGIGAEVSRRGFFNVRNNDLDERTLRMIANKTKGRYFRARNTAELRKIYGLLDALEAIEREEEFFRTRQALYPYPLTAALLIALLVLLLRVSRVLGD